MTYNIPLMEKVEGLILDHPEQHNQNWWSSDDDRLPTEHCGTSACVAGWTAAALGYTVRDIEGMEREIDYWAAEQLGISEEERSNLFYNFNEERALLYLQQLIAKAKMTP